MSIIKETYDMIPMPKLGKKGQGTTGAVQVLISLAVMIFVGNLVLQNLDTSFSSEFDGGVYSGAYNDTSDNLVSSMSLMSVLPILVSAGALLAAVTVFTR